MILVTGGCGFVGSNVVNKLTKAGHEVIVVDNLSKGAPDALLLGEKLIQVDLLDLYSLKKVFETYEIETVFHFAANISVEESVREPLKYLRDNVLMTSNLLHCCNEFHVRNFIFSSTAAVYGLPPDGIAYEWNNLEPINPYGQGKALCEQLITDNYANASFKSVILRYFNVAGANRELTLGQRDRNPTHLIRLCVQAALGIRDSVTVYGNDYDTPDGTAIRDYIHIRDLTNIHLKALYYLEHGGKGGTFNAGYGRGYSVLKVINTVKSISGVNFPVLYAGRRVGDPQALISANKKIKAHFNWEPRYGNLADIISSALKWEEKLFI